MQTIARGVASYQVPQFDFNFGVGDRIQLTYEVPYVIQSSSGTSLESGWGNAYPGIKWRFLDQGEDGWQLSTFPQLETAASALAREKEIAVPGPRYLLPMEATKKVGTVSLDLEVGYYAGHGPKERILGVVAGRPLTERLELDAEIYDDRAYGTAAPHSTTLDLGGRYKLHRGLLALFMAGRSITGFADGRPEFIGYVGLQVLLSDYGRTLSSEP